ncbi:hypothetical protein CCUS01_17285 [Colletotrichum cuscutae]|uniref:Uncharacterized protein n=1 Tax=Colletotrichum cuscutae TaxID=1209917 RepID=A0AAI9Y1X2_9PEZI|nr:hypothetical protein CCUS01_17285 [Colletotrichum cuscutae]
MAQARPLCVAVPQFAPHVECAIPKRYIGSITWALYFLPSQYLAFTSTYLTSGQSPSAFNHQALKRPPVYPEPPPRFPLELGLGISAQARPRPAAPRLFCPLESHSIHSLSCRLSQKEPRSKGSPVATAPLSFALALLPLSLSGLLKPQSRSLHPEEKQQETSFFRPPVPIQTWNYHLDPYRLCSSYLGYRDVTRAPQIYPLSHLNIHLLNPAGKAIRRRFTFQSLASKPSDLQHNAPDSLIIYSASNQRIKRSAAVAFQLDLRYVSSYETIRPR